MHKKLIGGCMVLTALFAYAVMPAMASASPEIGETSGGVFMRLATGTRFIGTNVGELKFTGSVNVGCDHGSLTGELHVNSGSEITGNITGVQANGTGTSTDCTAGGESTRVTWSVAGSGHELPWCLKSTGEDKFTVRGNSCTNPSRPVTIAFDYTGIGLTCKYKKEGTFSGSFETDTSGQDAVLTMSEQEVKSTSEGNNIFCPTSGKLDMSFTLETDGTNIPLYVK
jgi:hypothetical protein